ncbi:MAG: hypothetical protein DHS20C14_09740 [Phycisphaeraceae bacterium]|nr:MAG: hypothetical protein DHS20C14_09740 [Phycisphaeraceae bacterium]
MRTLRAGRQIAAVGALAGAMALSGCNNTRTGANGGTNAGGVRANIATTREQRAEQSLERGEQLEASGDIDAALAEFERAIAINPELTPAYIKAGDIYRNRKEYEMAESRYGRAAELEPANFDAQYLHGLVLQLMGRVHESVRAYLRALAIRPDDFEANMNLGTAYLQLNDAGQALQFSQRAVRIQPDSGPARINLGAVYAALDRHEAAVIEYQQAAELMPEPDPRLLLNLADSLGRIDRHPEMVATLEQLVRTDPSPEAYERLGAGLFRMRRYEDALGSFEGALDIDTGYYPALNGVAVCRLNQYLWSGKSDEDALLDAVSALRRSLQIERRQPKIVELLRRYGSSAGQRTSQRYTNVPTR